MLHGRVFTDADDQNTQYVAIVNEAMAKKYWPNEDPIGRRFKMGADPEHSMTVVGVVKDAHVQGLTGSINPYFYAPILQHYVNNSLEVLQLRTAGARRIHDSGS